MGLPENSSRGVPLSRTSNLPGDEMTLTHTGLPINCLRSKQSEFLSSLADPTTTSPDQGDSVPEEGCVCHLAMAPTSPLIPAHAYLARTQGCVEGSSMDCPLQVSGMRAQSPNSPVFILLASLPCHFTVLCT